VMASSRGGGTKFKKKYTRKGWEPYGPMCQGSEGKITTSEARKGKPPEPRTVSFPAPGKSHNKKKAPVGFAETGGKEGGRTRTGSGGGGQRPKLEGKEKTEGGSL